MIEAAPAEPIPFRVLLDEAMKLTRRHFRVMYLPVAIPLAVLTGVTVFVQLQMVSSFTSAGADPASFLAGGGCLIFLLTILLAMVMYGLTSGVMTAGACDGVANRPIDMKAKWVFILQPSTIGTMLLSLLAVVAGLICLVIPGIYIGLALSFVVPVMAVEGLKGPDALGRSWKLVRYNPHNRFFENTMTKIFLLGLVAGLISYAVAFLIQLPFTILHGIAVARSVSSGAAANSQAFYASTLWTQLPSAVLGSFVSTAVSIYSAFGIALLYFDVVRRKEGTDLASAIDARFGAPPVPGSIPPPSPLA